MERGATPPTPWTSVASFTICKSIRIQKHVLWNITIFRVNLTGNLWSLNCPVQEVKHIKSINTSVIQFNTMEQPTRPPFSDLPLDKEGPPGNAWGLYGFDDELGALNMITPSTVQAAAKEIRTGDRISLDWYLNLPSHPSFGRPSFGWRMENRTHPDGTKRIVNDDHLDINTQSSSQWDGFRHYGYQQAARYYGGRTQEDIETRGVIGIDRIAHSGGITARGVILDYPRYLEKKGREVDALSSHAITPLELREMLEATGVQTRDGDLLLLRTGFTKQYEQLGEQERKELPGKPPAFAGVESSKETCKWIWESGFVAVAG